MAYTFAATSDRIAVGTRALPVPAGTFAAWWYPTWAQGDGITHLLFDVRNAGVTNVFNVFKSLTNSLNAQWITSGTAYTANAAAGTYTLNQNAWNVIVVTWDDTANELRLYLNGTQIASNTTNLVTHTTADTRLIGNIPAFTNDARGDVANVSFWSVVLDSTARANLAAGYHPMRVNQADLVNCWDLYNSTADLGPNGDTGTATGAAVTTNHPTTPRPSVLTPDVLRAA